MNFSRETTLSSKGQVTIPPEIRELTGLQLGQKIWVSIGENREVVLKPESGNISGLFGMFKADRHVSVEEMSAEHGPDDDLD